MHLFILGRTARVALKNAEKFSEIVFLPEDLIVDMRKMLDALSWGMFIERISCEQYAICVYICRYSPYN